MHIFFFSGYENKTNQDSLWREEFGFDGVIIGDFLDEDEAAETDGSEKSKSIFKRPTKEPTLGKRKRRRPKRFETEEEDSDGSVSGVPKVSVQNSPQVRKECLILCLMI